MILYGKRSDIQMEKEYTKENIYRQIDNLKKYIANLLKESTVITAEKSARISARKGIVGETITTWSADVLGNPIIEMESTVEKDKESGNPGWVVTKVDANGNEVIDKNGHKNIWIIDDTTFKKKYKPDEITGLFKPAGNPQLFIQLKEPVTIFQWGKRMKIDHGGYINITDPDDYYAVSKRDFDDTYTIIK